MIDRLEQIIVAVSSAPGRGATGIVRLSGPGCWTLSEKMYHSKHAWRAGMRLSGEVAIDEQLRLPAWLYLYRAPRSYTRQDLVEIQTLGCSSAVEAVRARAMALGALPARPGEFTARAFLLGAMDLGQAEAVAALIRAQSDVQLRASRRMMDGALHSQISTIRDRIAELLALVEADIDFAEEPIEFITPGQLRTRTSEIAGELEDIVNRSISQERLEGLPRILLLGAPNAGKSKLLNALSGIPRAICAAVAGTTRDLLSAPIRIGRGEALLLDAAGIDESDDPIISQARTMTLAAAERVDLICLIVDATVDDVPSISLVRTIKDRPVIVVLNKSDKLNESALDRRLQEAQKWALGPVCGISAAQGEGLGRLLELIAARIGEQTTTASGDSIALTERQRTALVEGLGALRRASALAADAAETADAADLIAFELREALEILGTVSGAVSTEDLLGQVFQRFCIGK